MAQAVQRALLDRTVLGQQAPIRVLPVQVLPERRDRGALSEVPPARLGVLVARAQRLVAEQVWVLAVPVGQAPVQATSLQQALVQD